MTLNTEKLNAGAYSGHFLLTLDASIDTNRLAIAVEKAVAAHPSIFVRIAEQNGEPVQQYSAEDYHQTVEQMTEEAWQKNCLNSSLSRLNFTAGGYSALMPMLTPKLRRKVMTLWTPPMTKHKLVRLKISHE